MSTFACDPGLRESVEALLSNLDGATTGFQQQVLRKLDLFLEPGELLLAYAGCPPIEKNETDAFAYTPGGPVEQTDAFAYPRGEYSPQVDAFAYDIELARRQPDIMGYEPRGRIEDTDAFAYQRPEPTPENDAFMSPASYHPAIHFLLLTDRRLIDGVVRDGSLLLTAALTAAPARVWVQTAWAPAD